MGSLDEKQLPVEANHSDEQFEEVLRTNMTGEISELVVVAEGEERTTLFVWLLVACSSISGLLFGTPSVLFFAVEASVLNIGRLQVTILVSSPVLW